MKRKLIAGILALALVATAVGVVSARNNYGAQATTTAGDERPFGQCWMNQLTEEQRQELHQQMQEFRQELRAQYNISAQNGPGFVDEDGDGICDHQGTFGQGHQRGYGFRWLTQTSTHGE